MPSGSGRPTATRYVVTAEIKAVVKDRETEVLDALAIRWRDGRPHIRCPYRDHDDANPSWRWDHRASRARCTCTPGDSIFDVVMRREGCDFEVATLRVAELLGRSDLIREKNEKTGNQGHGTDAASLLNPMVGLNALGYYEAPPPGSKAKPELVGAHPCAVFGTVAADGRTHAHRIYLAPGGAGKADLGTSADGRLRDPKKSART